MLREHDLSKHTFDSQDAAQPNLDLPECLLDIISDIGISTYKEVLPQLSCDQRLDAVTNEPTTAMTEKEQLQLETNTTSVGCTNETRCWSLYLLGLSALNKGKKKGELKALWNGTDERELKCIRNARNILEEALVHLGSTISDLKRKVQRSLALVLGPDQNSDILGTCASDLIHLSLNEGTIDRLKNRFGPSHVDANDWMARSIRNFKETKENFPSGLSFLAMVSCPTGELLLDIIDGSNVDQTCCIFPSTTESVADFLLCPLSDLLTTNNAQLENSGSIDRNDSTARRRWRQDRRDLDELFQQHMQGAQDVFFSANLPANIKQILFGGTIGNLCSRFDRVANEDSFTEPTSERCLVLLLDELLHKFPFEALDFFEDRAICRLPSVLFASEYRTSATEVERDKVSYILNPESDLDDTEERLLPLLQSLGNEKWKSYVQKKPQNKELHHALARKNSLVMYFGHGGGERVISKDQLELLRNDGDGVCSSVILMGCSSGLLHSPNQDKGSCNPCSIHFEPDGLILQYLLLGSPCVIGNLWDVTDRDIDIFTEKLLRFLFQDGQSTAQSVASARSACKYRFLTGGAPVCYGLPLKICNKTSSGSSEKKTRL